MFPDSQPIMMSLEMIERTSIPPHRRTNFPRPGVRAATILNVNSSTEIIDVNQLSQKNTSVVQYVDVADSKGRLYCVNGLVNPSCWIKIITIAKDCQSCNVLLTNTEKGVVLKVMKCIVPGEPLLMWFTENILAMMNMPFLTPSNIQGQNRYICHICNNHFEYPNPLKVHLALRCNRLDMNHLWTVLARDFIPIPPTTNRPMSLLPQSLLPFRFNLNEAESKMPTRISPIIVETTERSNSRNLPTRSRQDSPILTTQLAPPICTMNGPLPHLATTRVQPLKRSLVHRNASAFKPYENKPMMYPTNHHIVVNNSHRSQTVHAHNNYHHIPPPTAIRNDAHAAQMETLVSNLGKSKQGHLCIYCGKVYSRKYGLKIHIRTHTGYKPLKCKFCLRPFGDPSNLNKHVRLHADGETPYRCNFCDKVLVRRRDLERHIKSRHRPNADHHSDLSSDGMDT